MSTNKSKKLNQLIFEQEQILNELKEEASAIDNNSLMEENERLLAELKIQTDKNNLLQSETDDLKQQLSTTRSALFSKMADEKLSAFNRTQKRIESIYYYDSDGVGSRLAEYEMGCRNSINETIKVIENYGSSQYDDIMAKLRELNNELSIRHSQVEQYATQQIDMAVKTNNSIGDRIKNEPLTDSEKQSAFKQKSVETFVGLNILSKAGILLFIVGIVMLGRYAYVHMSDVFRGALIYGLGIILVAIGELFHKKEKTVFSTALISGGVAVLYSASATCYFAFSLYSARVAFVICIVITAFAIALSHQLKSQVVCAFGAVGGYLPVVVAFMIGFGKAAADITFLPASSVYFCILAVIIFIMTYNKKWYVAQYIGYALHILAVGGIAECAWSLKGLSGYDYALPLATAFAIASFVIYLMMPGVKIVKRKPLGSGDVTLLGINTLSGAVSVSITISNCFANSTDGDRAVGFVFLAFAVIYALLMACSVREKNQTSRIASVITSVSALVFSMLVVPFVFGIEYAPIAWVVEGMILAVISVEKQLKVAEYSGLACMLIALFLAFVDRFDIGFSSYSILAIVTVCTVLVAFWIYTAYGILTSRADGRINPLYIVTQLMSSLGTFGVLCYLYQCIIHGPFVHIYSDFTNFAFAIIFALAVAVVIKHGALKNDVVSIFSDIVGVILPFVAFGGIDLGYKYYSVENYFGANVVDVKFKVFNLVLLIAVNLAVALFFAVSLGSLLNRGEVPMWVYTVSISAVALLLITATMMSQFNIAFSNVIISALYIATACVLLFIGFKKRYTVVRSGGLILILCAFAKLCFVDTSHLDSAWKIASYFAFGALLIVISYFYQRFTKKLENDVVNDIEK
jgi:uncharacterized membrane protein